jgi:hypothetical protein
MREDYRIRPYVEGDEKQIADLLVKVFRGWPHIDIELSPVEYWRWKYLENPLHRSYVSVCVDKGRIVSCQHESIVKIKIKDEQVRGISGQDLAVHPDYRGMRLSSGVISHANNLVKSDGITYCYFLTRNPVIMKRCETSENPESRRPSFPFQLVNLTWIEDLEKHLSNIPMKNPSLVKIGASALKRWNIARKNVFSSDDVQVEEINKFDQEVDKFLKAVYGDYNYMIIRDTEYINWKYSTKGVGDYRKFIVKENGKLVGYAVLRANRYNKKYPVGYIVELMTRKHRPELTSPLVEKALNYFSATGVNIVNFLTVKNHPYIDVLKGFGFIDSRVKINMYIPMKERHPAVEVLLRSGIGPETVHVAWGDFDVLPVGTEPHS